MPGFILGEKKNNLLFRVFLDFEKGSVGRKKFYFINLFYLYNTVYWPMIGLDPVSIIVQQGLLLNVTMLVFVMSPSRGGLHILQSELMSLCMYKHMVIHLIAEYTC